MEHAGIRMLDQALELAKQELAAIANEAYTDALELSKERGKLTNAAWEIYDKSLREDYRSRLLKLNAIHTKLTAHATAAHEYVRSTLQQSKRERRRMNGYHLAISQALQ